MSAPEMKVGQEWRTPMSTYVCKVLRLQGEEAVLEDVESGDIFVAPVEGMREMWVCCDG